jgi:hypothetical protein
MNTLINIDNVLLILNCEKYKYKANFQKTTWLKNLPSNYIFFHIIGNPNLNDKYLFDFSNNVLYVKCKDDYLTLPYKVILSIYAIVNTYNFKYIFKTDDDQYLTNNKLFEILPKLIQNYNYGGYNVSVETHYSQYYLVHNELPKDILLEKATYCNGRFYFLSKNICEYLITRMDNIKNKIIEDHAIGLELMNYKNIKILNFNSNLYFKDTNL